MGSGGFAEETIQDLRGNHGKLAESGWLGGFFGTEPEPASIPAHCRPWTSIVQRSASLATLSSIWSSASLWISCSPSSWSLGPIVNHSLVHRQSCNIYFIRSFCFVAKIWLFFLKYKFYQPK